MFPLVFATALSVHGLRRRSLSPGGAATAFVVGLCMMSGGVRVFGWTLVVFYAVGSRATRYGKQRKAELEDGYLEAGYRSGRQVLSNSLSAVLAAVLWNILFAPGSAHAALLHPPARDLLLGFLGVSGAEYAPAEWCPADPAVAHGWSRTLLFATLGHFACCLGDTLASELGILSPSRPRLLTTLRPVPPGTNGGVSPTGTLASVAGGLTIGLVMFTTLVIESPACRQDSLHLLLELVCWGAVGGFLGSMIDSLLGATIQQTKYSTERKLVLTDESKETSTSGRVVSGLNVLTNNQVNVASSVLTSIILSFC